LTAHPGRKAKKGRLSIFKSSVRSRGGFALRTFKQVKSFFKTF
jgi:hypothetical protein